MSLRISGQKLLGRFGWFCAEEKLEKKLMLQCDFDELKSCIENNDSPDSILLALCFPKPVRELRNLAINLGRNMWDYDVVMNFLLQHEGSGGDCATKVAIIITENNDGTVEVLCRNKTIFVFNSLNLPLDRTLPVLIHRRQIFAQEID